MTAEIIIDNFGIGNAVVVKQNKKIIDFFIDPPRDRHVLFYPPKAFMNAIDKGESPTILGDGSEAFDFVAVEDCAKANVCALKSNATDSFYNVGTGKRTSLKELAEILLELTDCKKPLKYIPRSQATFVKNRVGCPEKASKEINYTSSIDLKEGLQKLIDWRNSHKQAVASRRGAQRIVSN